MIAIIRPSPGSSVCCIPSRPRACGLGLLLLAALAAVPLQVRAGEAAPAVPLEEVVVTATFSRLSELDTPASVAVLDAATLNAPGQQHFEDVIAEVPNLNWAGDTARPRYFQIRGIGELVEYQGAPNPSVGLVIDNIDFSGLGTAATLFDMDRIEVLRGPQGARYGANALGGLIYATSAAPANDFGGRVELGVGDYNSRSYGGVVTGPVESLDSSFRLAVQRYTSDGYYTNAYLGRDNVANFDELTLRGRWHFQPSEQLQLDVTVLHVHVNDGYDNFAIDNSRNTQSDQPGHDTQHSTGAAATLQYRFSDALKLTTILGYANSPMSYAYDGDWGNPQLWAPYVYQSNEVQQRLRTTRNLESRLGGETGSGGSWIVGVYAMDLRESLTDTIFNLYQDPTSDYFPPAVTTVTTSQYESHSTALFGEFDQDLGHALRLSLGLRGERRTVAYSDVVNATGTDPVSRQFAPANNLWGGNLSLAYKPSEAQTLYALVSRGYKAGGFNLSQGLPTSELYFAPEYDLNFETGYKAELLDRQLQLDTALFYMQRHSLQVLTGTQLEADNPSSFVFYTGNASSGFNYGLESSLEWRWDPSWTVGASLGLLQTRYHGFVQNEQVLPDRELPHAPAWQAAVHLQWQNPQGAFARVEATGMGSFYFDLPPNPTASKAYGLLNGRVGYAQPSWTLALWGKNLLNKEYAVRGFYFGDVPPDFPNQTYVQLGAPRTLGLSLTVNF